MTDRQMNVSSELQHNSQGNSNDHDSDDDLSYKIVLPLEALENPTIPNPLDIGGQQEFSIHSTLSHEQPVRRLEPPSRDAFSVRRSPNNTAIREFYAQQSGALQHNSNDPPDLLDDRPSITTSSGTGAQDAVGAHASQLDAVKRTSPKPSEDLIKPDPPEYGTFIYEMSEEEIIKQQALEIDLTEVPRPPTSTLRRSRTMRVPTITPGAVAVGDVHDDLRDDITGSANGGASISSSMTLLQNNPNHASSTSSFFPQSSSRNRNHQRTNSDSVNGGVGLLQAEIVQNDSTDERFMELLEMNRVLSQQVAALGISPVITPASGALVRGISASHPETTFFEAQDVTLVSCNDRHNYDFVSSPLDIENQRQPDAIMMTSLGRQGSTGNRSRRLGGSMLYRDGTTDQNEETNSNREHEIIFQDNRWSNRTKKRVLLALIAVCCCIMLFLGVTISLVIRGDSGGTAAAISAIDDVVPTDVPSIAPTRSPLPGIPTLLPVELPVERSTPVSTEQTPVKDEDSSGDNPEIVPTRAPGSAPIIPWWDVSSHPSSVPTVSPSSSPSSSPEPSHSPVATANPTRDPTREPTREPTEEPTRRPTREPTEEPTRKPTSEPTSEPTQIPTRVPTSVPTSRPSRAKTPQPTNSDTVDESRPLKTNPPTNVAVARVFETKHELAHAVDQYMRAGPSSVVGRTYGSMSEWNVSQIEDFSEIFSRKRNLNFKQEAYGASLEDISRWDTSRAVTMAGMFHGFRYFEQDLSAWNVSRVTDMTEMFELASLFNGDISSWDVSNVKKMERTFNAAQSFTGDLSGWQVSRVTSMEEIFLNAALFNSELSLWDVQNVRFFSRAFRGAGFFRRNLSRWRPRSVVSANAMFHQAGSFAEDLCAWGSYLPENAQVDDMFTETKCEDGQTPVYQGNGRWSPMCVPCPSLEAPSTTPSEQPSAAPTAMRSEHPSAPPTEGPTLLPSSNPIIEVSSMPTLKPSLQPTWQPTTQEPSERPSMNPSLELAREASPTPTFTPTVFPTANPSQAPTRSPSKPPTSSPSFKPTPRPTETPTSSPSSKPTPRPTETPTSSPISQPTQNPTVTPTLAPTQNPTQTPTTSPTQTPTSSPTAQPSPSPVYISTETSTRPP